MITGADLAHRQRLAWMPTISADVQAVLATDKVQFQGPEVAFVIAHDRYAARDALELIVVEYEQLTPVMGDARTALDPGAPLVRDNLAGRADNRIFDWAAGDKSATDAVFATADVVVGGDMLYPRRIWRRWRPAESWPTGPGGREAHLLGTSQAPHAHRTMYAMMAGLPEHKIRIISPDIGGGFGNKVPIYPGYLCAVAGAMLTGSPSNGSRTGRRT